MFVPPSCTLVTRPNLYILSLTEFRTKSYRASTYTLLWNAEYTLSQSHQVKIRNPFIWDNKMEVVQKVEGTTQVKVPSFLNCTLCWVSQRDVSIFLSEKDSLTPFACNLLYKFQIGGFRCTRVQDFSESRTLRELFFTSSVQYTSVSNACYYSLIM